MGKPALAWPPDCHPLPHSALDIVLWHSLWYNKTKEADREAA